MLGALDQTYLLRILDALADGDGPALMTIVDEIAARSLSFGDALSELGALLHRVARLQAIPPEATVAEDSTTSTIPTTRGCGRSRPPLARGRPALLPDRRARPARPAARARRDDRLLDGAAADARVPHRRRRGGTRRVAADGASGARGARLRRERVVVPPSSARAVSSARAAPHRRERRRRWPRLPRRPRRVDRRRGHRRQRPPSSARDRPPVSTPPCRPRRRRRERRRPRPRRSRSATGIAVVGQLEADRPHARAGAAERTRVARRSFDRAARADQVAAERRGADRRS